MDHDQLPNIIQQLYDAVQHLEGLYPGRKFTLDGHLVGSLGEVIAAHVYDLKLLPSSSECHDAQATDGRMVQVKATQINSISLYSEPQYLIVLQIQRDGSHTEVYNGPGHKPWIEAGRVQKNGQKRISLSKLRMLMQVVHPAERIPRVGV